jgi:hypothetical protein
VVQISNSERILEPLVRPKEERALGERDIAAKVTIALPSSCSRVPPLTLPNIVKNTGGGIALPSLIAMTAIDLLIGSFVLYMLGCLWVIWMLCKRIDQWRAYARGLEMANEALQDECVASGNASF